MRVDGSCYVLGQRTEEDELPLLTATASGDPSRVQLARVVLTRLAFLQGVEVILTKKDNRGVQLGLLMLFFRLPYETEGHSGIGSRRRYSVIPVPQMN